MHEVAKSPGRALCPLLGRPEQNNRFGNRIRPTAMQRSTSDLIDWLAAEVAVVDQNGAIVRGYWKWADTARVGKLTSKPGGWNYFAECEAAAARGCVEAAGILAGLRAVLQGALPVFFATYVCPFVGRHHWFQVMITPVPIGGKRHAILMHVDVSALQVDALTGLPNRAMFEEQLALNLSTARATGQRTGVIFIDINRLKQINDMHGHLAGDAAIKALASALKAEAGEDTVVARVGGDEFGMVPSVSYDTLLGPRLRAHLKTGVACPIPFTRTTMTISAAVGVALYPEDGTTAKELFTAADKSMYAQKCPSVA
jgi:diguanylate cyclase (GGDEF)-like protein